MTALGSSGAAEPFRVGFEHARASEKGASQEKNFALNRGPKKNRGS